MINSRLSIVWRNRWQLLLLFLLPFLLSSLLLPALTRLAVSFDLNRKMSMLVENFHARRAELTQSARMLLPRLHYDCSGGDIRLLRSPESHNLYIRVIGIMGKDGSRCSSIGQSLFPPLLTQHQLSDGFHITTTAAEFDSRQELVVLHNQDGNLVYWVLNGGWSMSMLANEDRTLFHGVIHHLASGLHSQFGDASIEREPHAQRLRFEDQQTGVSIELWAGERLMDQWQQRLFEWILPLSLLCGLGLATLYWHWRKLAYAMPQRLKKALQRREFTPYYQPIVDAAKQQVVGYEVLIRWREKGRKWVSPSEFIDAAEDSQLIIPITEQLMEQVLQDLPLLPPKTWVSINISAIHVEGVFLESLLARLHWPQPERICFELTERKPIQDFKQALLHLSALMARGYDFKLDDFGTGYGGFAYLQRLNIQQIKIDKMFVDHLTEEGSQTLLHGIISFGHQTTMQMIAEGVESPEQVRLLGDLGVHLIQGYVFARPMPINELLKWQLPNSTNVAHPRSSVTRG